MDELTLQQLDTKIRNWFYRKGIIDNSDEFLQFTKLMEEMTELLHALLTGDTPKIRDGMGDVFVVLVGISEITGNDLTECVGEVFDIINKRTGEMKEGVFVKDAV